MPGSSWISFIRFLQSVSCLCVSLLVVTAGRGDCTERKKKAGEGESKAWMDKAATGDGKGHRRRTWRGTWRRAIANSVHTRGAQSHSLWVLFSTREILAFLGKSIFISYWWDCKMWQPSPHIWVSEKTHLKPAISRTWNSCHSWCFQWCFWIKSVVPLQLRLLSKFQIGTILCDAWIGHKG